jgi:hypothetical protein
MCNFISRLHTFLLGLCFIGFAALPSVAQAPMQATSVVGTPARTTNAPLAVDGQDGTAAALSAYLLNPATLRVGFGSAVVQNQQAMLLIKGANGGLLDLSLLGSIVINTYSSASPNSVVQSVPVSSNSVTLALVPGTTDITQVTFPVTQSFNQLEMRVTSTASVATPVSLYAVYAMAAPLPVSLTAFSGKATAAGIVLNWETASEQHNDHFVVERAEGTPENFRALGKVAGASSSTQHHQYQFVDAQASDLSYYRLRQVDLDGSAHFSPVVAVQAALPSQRLLAYPTLATETLTVVGAHGAQVSILDHLGRQVRVAALSDSAAPQLDVRSLPAGVYFLRDATTGQRTRFVKDNAR